MKRGFVLAIIAGAILAVTAIACGGGDGDDAAASPTSTPTPAATGEATSTPARTATPAPTPSQTPDSQDAQTDIRAEDQALADSVVLKLSDFATGWRADESDDEDDDENGCGQPDYSALTITGRADSPTFTRGSVASVSSTAVVYTSQDDAISAYQLFEGAVNQEIGDCLAETLEDTDGIKVIDISAGRLSFPSFGDRSAAYQIAIEYESEGLTPTFYVDIVVLQDGRALAALIYLDLLTPFSDSEKERLTEIVAGRMQ